MAARRETEKKKEGDERAARSAASPALANASKVAQSEAAHRASTQSGNTPVDRAVLSGRFRPRPGRRRWQETRTASRHATLSDTCVLCFAVTRETECSHSAAQHVARHYVDERLATEAAGDGALANGTAFLAGAHCFHRAGECTESNWCEHVFRERISRVARIGLGSSWRR